ISTSRFMRGMESIMSRTSHRYANGVDGRPPYGQTAERAARFTQTVRQGSSGTYIRAARVGARRTGALLRVHRRSLYRLNSLWSDTPNERRHLLYRGN